MLNYNINIKIIELILIMNSIHTFIAVCGNSRGVFIDVKALRLVKYI